jgi:3,4-dihydroxy-9,10-secoandrosta-1,3,5(10)-triene-9,17-dione 4,5-dioxygenase
MDIRGLGYIGIDVADLGSWREYAGLLGTMAVPDDNGLRLKIDERPFRVLAQATEGSEGLAFAGWEVPDAAALEASATELEKAGCPTEVASAAECADRRVRGLIGTTDPSGFAIELFHGPIHDHQLFVSPTGVSGFVTGPQGLGHIVLGTPHLSECVDFYSNLLGFRVSDYWRPGDDDVVFMRCNQRHHSLALVPAPEAALYHFMLEARTLDDVGYTLDRHYDSGAAISMGIGKHTNDRMVSFYSRSPSGFDVEFGFGGLLVDEATWTVTQISEPSFWGHHPPPTAS